MSFNSSDLLFQPEEYVLKTDSDILQFQTKTSTGTYAYTDMFVISCIRYFISIDNKDLAKRIYGLVLYPRIQQYSPAYLFGFKSKQHLLVEAVSEINTKIWNEIIQQKNMQEIPFMQQNFKVYHHRICIDTFKKMNRDEGFSKQGNDQTASAGKPRHIPQTNMVSIDYVRPNSEERQEPLEIADNYSLENEVADQNQIRDVLLLLNSHEDVNIVYMRVFLHMQWNEIASIMKISDRTARNHYQQAMQYLKSQLSPDSLFQSGDTHE